MYALRMIKPIAGQQIVLELPADFPKCTEAEVIVLPGTMQMTLTTTDSPRDLCQSTEEFIARFAGSLGEDFPDDISDESGIRPSLENRIGLD